MKNFHLGSAWASRLILSIAIILAFAAGYGWRAQVSESARWLPPGSRLQAFFSSRFRNPRLTIGASANAQSLSSNAKQNDVKPYELLDEVRRDIKNNFYKQDVDETELTYGAVRGMLSSLGDRFTRFMTPDDYKEFQVKNNGEFVGIGARITTIEKYVGDPTNHRQPATRPIIVGPIENSPAEKVGLRKDDVLISVDGRDTADMSLDAVVSYIRGRVGTTLKLLVERQIPAEDENKAPSYQKLNLEIKRDVIEVHPVHLHWLPKGIAWIELDEFNKKSDEEMTAALTAVKQGANGHKPAKALIIDMRNNPGGLLDVVVNISSNFVAEGPVVYTHERTGEMRAMNADKKRFLNLNIPIAVLVNNYSASAAEILTGALKDNGLATVVGEHTYGKASVQVLLDLSNGGALAITTAHYLTPLKHDISNKGIAPDITVKASERDEIDGRGDQLHKAMAILEAKI